MCAGLQSVHPPKAVCQQEEEKPIDDEDSSDSQPGKDTRYQHGQTEGYCHDVQARLSIGKFPQNGGYRTRACSRSFVLVRYREKPLFDQQYRTPQKIQNTQEYLNHSVSNPGTMHDTIPKAANPIPRMTIHHERRYWPSGVSPRAIIWMAIMVRSRPN